MSQFVETFFEESLEGLDAMESALLDADGLDAEAINAVFRSAHSIKGGSGTFGFSEVAEFTHLMETLLDGMRDGSLPVSTDRVQLLLESVDCVREMLHAARAGESADRQRVEALCGRLRDAQASATAASHVSAAPAVDHPGSSEGWCIQFRPQPHVLKTGNEPLRLFRELAELGELTVHADTDAVPPFADLDPEECHVRWELELVGRVDRAQIDEIFEWVADDCALDIQPIAARAQETAGATDSQAGGEPRRQNVGQSESNSIRVSTEKIDALINMVGELVITQSMLTELGSDESGEVSSRLRDGLAQLERNTRDLQESVMRIRMIPIRFAFSRLPRLVHDLNQNLGKDVTLALSGEDTELDKTVMERLGDPLLHLVRNAIDHGVEAPAERVAAGKPEQGTLRVAASHQGGNIVIEVTDDGRGLNTEAILAKARQRGVVGENEQPSPEAVHDLIFHPGFSTSDEVSAVSGRGVGMDVVRRNINDLGGSVTVASTEGKGTTFTVCLPLTLAVMEGQLLRVGGQVFIVPLVAIIESTQINKNELGSLASGAEFYRFREEYLPVVRMAELLGVGEAPANLDDGLLVCAEGGGYRAAILVDELLGQQQVVIKSLENNYRRVEGISGATILGDGSVALIIDVAGLIRLHKGVERKQSQSQVA